jgi:DNA-binding XRE family transcriptional regulator
MNPCVPATSVGWRIRRARNTQQRTMTDVGHSVGVTRHSVSNWEGDVSYPELRTLIKLCTSLGVSSDYLLGLDT